MIRRIVLVAGAALLACGGETEYGSAAELIQAAPPEWQPQGTVTSAGGASFTAPAGWSVTQYQDGVGLTSPQDSDGDQCELFVLQPRPTAADEEGRFQQALDAARGLFPTGTQFGDQYGGSDPLADRWRGSTGRGWSYAGLQLTAPNNVEVMPFVADFSGTAVPVVVVESNQSSWECVNVLGDFNEDVATVFHTLKLDSLGETETPALAQNVIGKWFSSDGTAGTLFIAGANGHYSDTSAYGGTVEVSPGEWEDQYATWTGDGTYQVRGDVLGQFPSDGSPESHYIREFEYVGSGNEWKRRLCWISEYEGNPYTLCLAHQDP